MDLKKTSLVSEHKNLGAYMAGFGGFYMPIQYKSVVKEHIWCRSNCAVFDTAHMGQFLISGDSAEEELNFLVTCDVSKIQVWRCKYSLMLNKDGGIIDDLIIYKLPDDKFMLVVNAGTTDKDETHIRENLKKSDLKKITPEYGKVDIQGPDSRRVLEENFNIDLSGLKYFSFDYFDVLGESFMISRTGYTGELGYEAYIKSDKICEFWRKLLADSRVKPAGLAARDTLRLEAGLPLYGQDADETKNPWQAGLAKFVDLDSDFVGKDKLLNNKDNVDIILSHFVSDSKRAPRHNYKIFKADGEEEIGVVTSGTYSPTLKCGIGCGYVKMGSIGKGTTVAIKSGSKSINAKIVGKPILKNK